MNSSHTLFLVTGNLHTFLLDYLKFVLHGQGGGEVQLSCPVAKQLPPINMTQEGQHQWLPLPPALLYQQAGTCTHVLPLHIGSNLASQNPFPVLHALHHSAANGLNYL